MKAHKKVFQILCVLEIGVSPLYRHNQSLQTYLSKNQYTTAPNTLQIIEALFSYNMRNSKKHVLSGFIVFLISCEVFVSNCEDKHFSTFSLNTFFGFMFVEYIHPA